MLDLLRIGAIFLLVLDLLSVLNLLGKWCTSLLVLNLLVIWCNFLLVLNLLESGVFFLLVLDFMHLVQVLIIPGSLFVKGRFPVYYTYPKHMNSEW